MTVRKHATKSIKHFNLPVSYRLLDGENLSDSRNIYDNKGVAETRYGIKRLNSTSLGGAILSVSYFKKSDGTRYRIAKVGGTIYAVSATGAHTAIKTGLSTTTKHRAVTLGNRHIIGIESDGLYSFDGTDFTQLGQNPPTTGSIALVAGGSLTNGDTYYVAITFYSTETGFESNKYELGSVTATASDKKINVSSIPASADNATIDKVRIYLKRGTGDYVFASATAEIDLGTTTFVIDANSSSTQTPPTRNAAPVAGGGKYLSVFGKKLAYAGNSTFPNEVFISEEYLPDAFDDNADSQVVLQIPGQGPITALATGLFNDQYLTPFLVAFKKTSISIYSELNSIPELVELDAHVGCISHETIRVRNGIVFFMSENGWYAIVNGAMQKDEKGLPVSLGRGAIDDIFSRVGWTYELNIPQAQSFFSAYFSTNSQYLTFVCEGANTAISKAYVYEEKIAGFRVWEFKSILTCACEGEDDSGYQSLFIGDNTGTIFTYSTRNELHDEDNTGASQSIPTYALFPYIIPGDDSCSYNFRFLTVRALSSSNPITVRAFPSFSLLSYDSFQYDFPNSALGFTLDMSQLDVDVLGDERIPVTAMADINRTGETLLIGFYQDIVDANIGLISAQLTLNKNGNRNL